MRRIARDGARQQRQAHPVGGVIVGRVVAFLLDRGDVKAVRDAAILSIMTDGLLRRSEVAALRLSDVDADEHGMSVIVREAKNLPAGEVDRRYLSDQAAEAINRWLDMLGDDQDDCGYLFRPVMRGGVIRHVTRDRTGPADGRGGRPARLDGHAVNRMLKARLREAKEAGALAGLRLDRLDLDNVSGHSLRVGGALDFAEGGEAILEIMKAGGWRSAEMVSRYTSRLDVRNGAAARRAIAQGRSAA
ncbi:MAG: tyrosine-type recombinase/integrase [Azospirillaceae bacterium]